MNTDTVCDICGYTEKDNDAHFGISRYPFSRPHVFVPYIKLVCTNCGGTGEVYDGWEDLTNCRQCNGRGYVRGEK